jgi:hypothetical protein
MVDGGEVKLPDGISREQFQDDLDHPDNIDKLMVVPHRITALKPAV